MTRPTPNNDASVLENTLQTWYAAIQRHDLQAAADLLTPDFVMVEHTEVLDKSKLLAYLADGMNYGTQTSQLVDFKATFHGDDLAWATLRNLEVWTPNDGEPPMDLEFVETAIFRQVDGRWMLAHYHATNTEPPPVPEAEETA